MTRMKTTKMKKRRKRKKTKKRIQSKIDLLLF